MSTVGYIYQSYSSLLDQYSSVSYGDQLFAVYLLLPLQQQCPVDFRRMFWIDHVHIVRLLKLKPKEVVV